VPLQSVIFPNLVPSQRTEAASVMNLVRSVGSSIGVSVALTMLTRTAAGARSVLVEHVTPYHEALRHADVSRYWDLGTVAGLAQIDRQVDLQAAMIGYAAEFRLLAYFALAALPLLILIPKPRPMVTTV
jgi:DHA2 family multidrug resistance protein